MIKIMLWTILDVVLLLLIVWSLRAYLVGG